MRRAISYVSTIVVFSFLLGFFATTIANAYDYSGDYTGTWHCSTHNNSGALSIHIDKYWGSCVTFSGYMIPYNFDCGSGTKWQILNGSCSPPLGYINFDAHGGCSGHDTTLSFRQSSLVGNTISGTYSLYIDGAISCSGSISVTKYIPPISWKIAAIFPNSGIWIYDSTGSSWTSISPSTPENIVYSFSTLYADFGAGGIWMWNGAAWTILTPSNPDNMVAYGSTLYADFGAGGLWMWNGSSWTMLTPSNPENMVVSGSTLYAEFGTGGIWMYNGSFWTMLTPSNPLMMVVPN